MKTRIAVLQLIGLMLVARGPAVDAQKAATRFREFASFDVQDFENTTGGDKTTMPDAWISTIREEIGQRVIELHKFQRVADFEDAKAATSSAARGLELKGKIVAFTRGSDTLRFFVGFGAGKGKIVARCQFIDKESGQVVLERQVDGRVIKTGQSTEGAIQGLAKEIKKIVDQNW